MSKYIDLIEKLSDRDKQIINAYIGTYGCPSEEFIGVEAWLQNWSHSNQKLYRLLGNSFIKDFPYEYEKNSDMVKNEVTDALYGTTFKSVYHDFYWNVIRNQDYLDNDSMFFFNHLLDNEHFIIGTVPYSLKIKKPTAKKILQIQKGTKILKAIGRVIDYFKDDFDFNLEAFENFKKKYAIIMSEKTVKGKFCVSIHPMDYITMSDNAANWQSCMNWKEMGCYHVGTVEMMNSNNVICAYLLNDDSQFIFNDKVIDETTGEIIGAWNNKRWRQLFYITKDIVMGGKSYPYSTKELTIAILDELKKLAKENMNWNYSFGPELYQDMVHVGNEDRMKNQRMWARLEKAKPVKHNIIWDTKGMYNDMLNDREYSYWCYRNKVNHTKVISVSGKTTCLCCGNPSLEIDEDNYDYNDRYRNTEDVICPTCIDTKFRCDSCGETHTRQKLLKISNGDRLCKYCQKIARICPCCGEIYYTYYDKIRDTDIYYNKDLYNMVKNGIPLAKNRWWGSLYPQEMSQEELENRLSKPKVENYGYDEDEDEDVKRTKYHLEKIFFHANCVNEDFMKDHCVEVTFPLPWSRTSTEVLYIIDPKIGDKYRFYNMQIPEELKLDQENAI